MSATITKITSGLAAAARELAKLREQIAEAQAERDRLEAAPVPRAEAEQRARAYIAALGERVHANTASLMAPGGRADVFAGFMSRSDGPRAAVELLAAAAPAALAQYLSDQLDKAYALAHAPLSDEQRAQKLADLDGTILDLERQEEQLIEAAEQAGITLDRRADADPAVVLGLAAA